jgi:two-component system heavy metal sensor histidine kinase CusS
VISRPLSIQARLTIALVGVLGLALPIFSIVFFSAFSRALIREFDARLADDAKSITAMVTEPGVGHWVFEAGPGALDDFDPTPDAAYYEVWLEDGTTFTRSLSLVKGDLQRDEATGTMMVTLPDGRPGRSITSHLPVRPEEPGVRHPQVTVVVARSTVELNSTLNTLERLLVSTLLAALLLAVVVVTVAIRTALSPLRQLSAQVDGITAERLDHRLATAAFPTELLPSVQKLNELLERLEAAFNRERQFAADVSHELRTPLAGLKATLEVGLMKPRGVEDYRGVLGDGLQIVGQLDALIEKLLLLARAGAGQIELKQTLTALEPFVDDCFALVAGPAVRRQLTFTNRIGAVAVTTDRTLLRMVVSNLINNAVSYTAAGGEIVVEADANALRIKDSGPPIPQGALDRIFGAFVRLEPSRSETGEHCGIGLALVKALCKTMKMTVEVRNEGSWVVFELRW